MQTSKNILPLLFMLLSSLPVGSYGQPADDEPWTLERALETARENNWEIQKSDQEILSRKAELNATLSAFLPSVGVSQGVTHTNDPLAVFGIKLQQEIVTQSDFDPGLLNNPVNTTDFHLGINVEQPLINPDAWAGRRAASLTLEAARLQRDHLRHHVTYLVKQSYFAIQLARERLQVLEEAHSNALENQRIAKNHLKQGLVNNTAVMAARVRVLDIESDMAVAKDQIKSTTEMLAFLLGLDTGVSIVPAEKLTMTRPPGNETGFDLNHRSDILAMKSATRAHEKTVAMQKLKFIPRLNAFGSYNFHSKELADFDAKSWVIGASLQWKLFSGNKNAAGIQKARANAQLAGLKQLEYTSQKKMELNKAHRQIDVAQTALISAEMAQQETAESYRIRLNRYKEGIERTTDLLAAEVAHAQKQLERLNALYNYNKAVFFLEYLTRQGEREDRRRETGDGRQKTGDGRRETGDGRQKREDRSDALSVAETTGDACLPALKVGLPTQPAYLPAADREGRH